MQLAADSLFQSEVLVTEKEALLNQLREYGAALERFQEDERHRERVAPSTREHQLLHLERRMLQLQTQLSALDLRTRRPAGRGPGAKVEESLWAALNPWHPGFQMGAYVAALAVLMLVVTVLPIVWR